MPLTSSDLKHVNCVQRTGPSMSAPAGEMRLPVCAEGWGGMEPTMDKVPLVLSPREWTEIPPMQTHLSNQRGKCPPCSSTQFAS